MTLSCHIPSLGAHYYSKQGASIDFAFLRARRNARGHLEPDASHDEVQASQGFQDFPSIDPNSSKST